MTRRELLEERNVVLDVADLHDRVRVQGRERGKLLRISVAVTAPVFPAAPAALDNVEPSTCSIAIGVMP